MLVNTFICYIENSKSTKSCQADSRIVPFHYCWTDKGKTTSWFLNLTLNDFTLASGWLKNYDNIARKPTTKDVGFLAILLYQLEETCWIQNSSQLNKTYGKQQNPNDQDDNILSAPIPSGACDVYRLRRTKFFHNKGTCNFLVTNRPQQAAIIP